MWCNLGRCFQAGCYSKSGRIGRNSYTFISVHRKPLVTLGTAFTILKEVVSLRIIVIKMGSISLCHVVHFRQWWCFGWKPNCPSFWCRWAPIEERLDFSGLSAKKQTVPLLKSKERQMLFQAHHIITRSQKPSIGIWRHSFFGRRKIFGSHQWARCRTFPSQWWKRKQFRKELGIHEDDEVFVYCGSLGPQYGWSQMMAVFEGYRHLRPKSLFYILTGNMEYAHQNVPKHLASSSIIRKVSFRKYPKYLNMADVGFAIRTLPAWKVLLP